MELHDVPVFMFLSVAAVALFSFVAVAVWADARSKERKAYYKSETIKKIAESQGGGSAALEYLREEQRLVERRMREGMKVGGLVVAGVGIGLMAFLGAIARDNRLGGALLGLIPFMVGIALLIYTYAMAPKDPER